jgi:hypothetical protein
MNLDVFWKSTGKLKATNWQRKTRDACDKWLLNLESSMLK